MKCTELKVSYKVNIWSQPLSNSNECYDFFIRIWDKRLISLQEQVYLVFLNGANEVISWRLVNTGTTCETLFDIKLSLSCALGCVATKIIIGHNHPSGLLKPSYDDIQITDRLNRAADLLEIKLMDHLILNPRFYYSFTDHGLLKM